MKILRYFSIVFILSTSGCGLWDEEFDSDRSYSIWDNAKSKLKSRNPDPDKNLNYIHDLDPLLENDYEDFDLADIIALSESKLEYDIDIYTPEQKQEFVDHHNIYRANMSGIIPEASDMNFIEYSPTLEKQAREWVKECKWQLIFSESNNVTPVIGQNLYKGDSPSPSRAMWLWYKEYEDYSFYNMSCKKTFPKHKCGHFTQMLWGDTTEIGCARRSYCFPLAKKHILVSCYYFTAGNWIILGFPIFRVGKPCTRCKSYDGNLCHKNLCIEKRICEKYNLDCSCKTSCKNCVRSNPATCRCHPCKSGWDWEDCSYPCRNEADDLSKDLCPLLIKNNATCKELVPGRWCKKFCGLCPKMESNLSDQLCCNGKICKQYYVLDEKTCECVLDCPSPLCLYPLNVNTNKSGTSKKQPVTGKPLIAQVTDVVTPKHAGVDIRNKTDLEFRNRTMRRIPPSSAGSHLRSNILGINYFIILFYMKNVYF